MVDKAMGPILGYRPIDALAGREVIVEFAQIGAAVKVSAMDTASLTEVCIQGPATAPREVLERGALARLEYVLRKKGLIR